jgi:DNA-binding NarL/FixJ family response regulator
MNMLFTEWNWDDALAIQREEGREEAVKNLLEFGMNPEQIARALKLPMDTVTQSLPR